MRTFHRRRDHAAPPVDTPTWGRPTRCPTCRMPGYVDRIDLVDRVMQQHCPACRTTWETAEAACAHREDPTRS